MELNLAGNITVIREDSSEGFVRAQEFYSSAGYYAQIQPGDIVFSAYEGDAIVGVVRLAPEEGLLVLRGMMIAKSHQRRGIGTKMLRSLEAAIPEQECFCLPHDWLEGFYGQIGFIKIEDHLAPPHLQERLFENRMKYPQLIAMERKGSSCR